jgi:hypothetical protein
MYQNNMWVLFKFNLKCNFQFVNFICVLYASTIEKFCYQSRKKLLNYWNFSERICPYCMYLFIIIIITIIMFCNLKQNAKTMRVKTSLLRVKKKLMSFFFFKNGKKKNINSDDDSFRRFSCIREFHRIKSARIKL